MKIKIEKGVYDKKTGCGYCIHEIECDYRIAFNLMSKIVKKNKEHGFNIAFICKYFKHFNN